MELNIISKKVNEYNVKLDGKIIDVLDFGIMERNTKTSKDIVVSEVRFIRKDCTVYSLEKYNITEDQYENICTYLENELNNVIY